MLTSRERVKRAIDRKQPDQVPIMDTVWDATENLWRKHGLPHGISAHDYLDFDMAWFAPDVSLQLPDKIIDQDDVYITYQDCNGCVKKDHKDFTTTPMIIRTIVQKPDDWYTIKERLKPDESRVNWKQQLQEFHYHHDKDRYTVFCAATGYDWTQHIIDSEQLLMYIAAEPDLVKDVYQTHADMILTMFDMMRDRGFSFDGALLFVDMGYRRGLLFSPQHYLEQFHPVLAKMCEHFHSCGAQTILHSCGRVKDLIPHFIDAGVDCLNPLEVKAGMDIIELEQVYGDRISFFGGIDTRMLEHGDIDTVRDTVTQVISTAAKGGGYIFGSDHSVSTGILFDTYREACGRARDISKKLA